MSPLYKTRFAAHIVVQDAEGSLSMPSAKQQDDEKRCVVLLEPGRENVVLSVQSVLARFRKKVLKITWNGVCRTRDACDKALQGLLMCVLFKVSSFSVVVWVE